MIITTNLVLNVTLIMGSIKTVNALHATIATVKNVHLITQSATSAKRNMGLIKENVFLVKTKIVSTVLKIKVIV